MSSAFRFGAAVGRARTTLVERLGLTRVPLPPELAHAEGVLRHGTVRVHAEAFGSDAIAYARVVTVRGEGLEVGSVLAIARPELGLPILGADLVALGTERGLLVADLSPSSCHRPAGVSARHPGEASLPSAGPLPGWCAPWFSAHAAFARLRPEHTDIAHGALEARVDAFVDLVAHALPLTDGAAEAAATTRAYLAAHRTDDKSFGVLAHAFGPAWASRLVGDVLFPEVSC